MFLKTYHHFGSPKSTKPRKKGDYRMFLHFVTKLACFLTCSASFVIFAHVDSFEIQPPSFFVVSNVFLYALDFC